MGIFHGGVGAAGRNVLMVLFCAAILLVGSCAGMREDRPKCLGEFWSNPDGGTIYDPKNWIWVSTSSSFWGSSAVSNTSGCGSDGKSAQEQEKRRYVAHNRLALESDLARGDGEYLRGLAALHGCGETQQAAFAGVLHGAHAQGRLHAAVEPGAWLATVRTLAFSDPSLRVGCAML